MSFANLPSILSNHASYDYQPWKRRPLPLNFWRTFYEDSHTPSRFVSNKHNGIIAPSMYIDKVRGQVNDDNAFEARSPFNFEFGLTQTRIRGHLKWGNAREPFSCFISVFESSGEFLTHPRNST
jgi:hypothetical protein